MLQDYLIIHKDIVPECYVKVLEAKRLIESGKVKEVSQAVRQVGISRSTYYKYKDFILEPMNIETGRKAVLSIMLQHEPGVLGTVLKCISDVGGSVLTITQSLPIRGKASVTIAIDAGQMTENITELMDEIAANPGVENAKLTALE